MPEQISPWLSSLNPEQRASALETGDICVVARAGTGKTKSIISRVIEMIMTRHYSPDRIILVTFTRRASNEMRCRLEASGCPVPHFTGTFHRVCSRLIRRWPGLLNNERDEGYSFMDEEDQKNVITRDVLTQITDDEWETICQDTGMKKPTMAKACQEFMRAVSLMKAYMIRPEDVDTRTGPARIKIPDNIASIIGEFGLILLQNGYYGIYEECLRIRNTLDYDDMIAIPVRALTNPENQNMRRVISGYFQSVIVDEHQDSNPVQVALVNALSGTRLTELHTVGDDGQSIYSWRGSEVRFIRERMDDPDVKGMQLFRNYRSSEKIIDLANCVLSHDTQVSDVVIEAHGANRFNDDDPELVMFEKMRDELSFLAQKVADRIRNGAPPNEIAILCRTRMLMSAVSKELGRLGIHYVAEGSHNMWTSPVVRSMVCMLMMVYCPDNKNIDLKLSHMIGPKARFRYGVTEKGLNSIFQKAETIGMENALMEYAGKLSDKGKTRMIRMMEAIRETREFMHGTDTLSSVAHRLYVESGLRKDISDAVTENHAALERLSTQSPQYAKQENELIRANRDMELIETELFEILSTSSDIENLMEQASLGEQAVSAMENAEAVNIMTIHAAKGLEFEHVFIPGTADNLFLGGNVDSMSTEQINEGCRLLYVAVTRAGKSVMLSSSGLYPFATGTSFNVPSLLQDIPDNVLKITGSLPQAYQEDTHSFIW